MPDLTSYNRAKAMLLKWEILVVRMELMETLEPEVAELDAPDLHDETRNWRKRVAVFRERLEESATDEEREAIKDELALLIEGWQWGGYAASSHSGLLF